MHVPGIHKDVLESELNLKINDFGSDHKLKYLLSHYYWAAIRYADSRGLTALVHPERVDRSNNRQRCRATKPVVDTFLLERLKLLKLELERLGIDMEAPYPAPKQHIWNPPLSDDALRQILRG